jgi:hypothetical protein
MKLDASEDGLNLFDELSQLLPNYKNKHDVTKNILRLKKNQNH